METHTTYTQARANLAKLCNQVTENRDVVIIRRRGGNDVALVAADELSSILETLHLLRSPKNADRLLSALRDAKAGKGRPQITSENLIVEDGGKITLPATVRDRYGLAQDTPVRMIQTRNGILLIPLTDEPMSEALSSELAEWQSVGAESFEMFPYEDQQA
jgi:antitoxin YefM